MFVSIHTDDQDHVHIESDCGVDEVITILEKAKFQVLSAYMPIPMRGDAP